MPPELGDQTRGAHAAPLGVLRRAGWGGVEPALEVAVAQTRDRVFAREDGLEELAVRVGDGIEPGDAAALVAMALAEAVERGERMSRSVCGGEAFEVAAVGGFAHLEVAPEVLDAFAHAHPASVAASPAVPLEAQHPEVRRVVDHGFNAQHGPLVVHLDPVLADAVLDAACLGPPQPARPLLALVEVALVHRAQLRRGRQELLAQEADDVVCGEHAQGVVEEVIELIQEPPAVLPHEVGGDFAGVDGPVVVPGSQGGG